MKKIKKTLRRLSALTLCLALASCAALAVSEDTVQRAPDVPLNLPAATAAPASYLPDPAYYGALGGGVPAPDWAASQTYIEPETDEYGEFAHLYQGPGLTPGEMARAQKLLAAYQAGEAKGDGASVLEATQNVQLGVYALDPADFDGERIFVILPGTCLTDEQLLALIDACSALGLTFDPAALDCRNCMRGGGIEVSRVLTSEERERRKALSDMIQRGVIDVSGVEPARSIALDARYFSGMERFGLYPYRRMTDEEFLQILVAQGAGPLGFDATDMERRAREILCGQFGLPLSMELDGIVTDGGYLPLIHDAVGHMLLHDAPQANSRAFIGADFRYVKPDGVEVSAYCYFDSETGELLKAGASDENPNADAQILSGVDHGAVTESDALKAAEAFAADIGRAERTWHVVGSTACNWGMCIEVMAKMGEGEWLCVLVGCDDGQAHGFKLDASERFAGK